MNPRIAGKKSVYCGEKSLKYFWGKNPRDLLLHSISVSGWERCLEIYSSPPTHTNLDEERGGDLRVKTVIIPNSCKQGISAQMRANLMGEMPYQGELGGGDSNLIISIIWVV